MLPTSLDDFYAIIREAKPSKGGRSFDLAFGIVSNIIPFALVFGRERLALPWLFWPDWMNPASDPPVFKGTFDKMVAAYFAEIPDGRLKFNLSDLDNSHSDSLTSWELRRLSSQYSTQTDYFLFEQDTYRQLSQDEASKRVAEILG